MISIDTNILLRYLLADDELQHKKANAIILKKQRVLITDVVLVEAVWTLTGKRYGLDKLSLCRVIRRLIGDSSFIFEDSQVIWSALNDYEESVIVRGKQLDFADALILHKSNFVAKKSGSTLQAFYSFDKAIEQLQGAKKP